MSIAFDSNSVDFQKSEGLVPVIVQDFATEKVLMLGYMNREALDKTLAEGIVTFFSRSKNRLWTKGETSGNFLFVKDFLKRDLQRKDLGVEVGSLNYIGQSTHYFIRTKALQSHSFLPEITPMGNPPAITLP